MSRPYPGDKIFDSFLQYYIYTHKWKLTPGQFVMQQLEVQDFPDDPVGFYEEFWMMGVVGKKMEGEFEQWFQDTEPLRLQEKAAQLAEQAAQLGEQAKVEAKNAQPRELKQAKKKKKNKKKHEEMDTFDIERQRAINEEALADIEQIRAKLAATRLRQAQTAAQMTLKELSPFGPLLTRIESYNTDIRSKTTITGAAAEADAFQKKLIASLHVV